MVKIGQKLHANMEGFRRAGHILYEIDKIKMGILAIVHKSSKYEMEKIPYSFKFAWSSFFMHT